MNVVITGANRGLGLGLARLYAERGDTVLAGARNPDNAPELHALCETLRERVRVLRLDVTKDDSCAAFVHDLGKTTIDILINNAGMYPEGDTLSALKFEDALRTYEVNTIAPLRVTRALKKLLRRPGAKVVNISSKMGSIADSSGGHYFYRMSKAALNMAGRSLAFEWQKDGITVASLHPGWVRTRMGGQEAPLDVDTSTRGMVKTIDGLKHAQTGGFFNYDGTTIPW